MRKNGSITVFLTLIFVVIMALITAVIENIRVLSSDAYVSVAADSAAETVMGDYNRELYEQYKLFGYGGYNGMGEMDINEEFMEILKDSRLIDRVLKRNMLVQVNAEYFTAPKTVRSAVRNLKRGNIHLIGSDCHNLTSRAPNLEQARHQAKVFGAELEFDELRRNSVKLLFPRGNR